MKSNDKKNSQRVSLYKRYTQRESAGLARGSKTLIETTSLLERNENSGRSPDTINARQEKWIKEYALSRGIWWPRVIKEFTAKYGKPIGNGQEAIVWGIPRTQQVIKTQNTLQYSTLQEKMHSIVLYNYYFPETALEVTGFGWDKSSGFQVIVKQPFIIADPCKIPSLQDMANVANLLGFASLVEYGLPVFKNERAVLKDIHIRNGIWDRFGNLFIIDSIMKYLPA